MSDKAVAGNPFIQFRIEKEEYVFVQSMADWFHQNKILPDNKVSSITRFALRKLGKEFLDHINMTQHEQEQRVAEQQAAIQREITQKQLEIERLRSQVPTVTPPGANVK